MRPLRSGLPRETGHGRRTSHLPWRAGRSPWVGYLITSSARIDCGIVKPSASKSPPIQSRANTL